MAEGIEVGSGFRGTEWATQSADECFISSCNNAIVEVCCNGVGDDLFFVAIDFQDQEEKSMCCVL